MTFLSGVHFLTGSHCKLGAHTEGRCLIEDEVALPFPFPEATTLSETVLAVRVRTGDDAATLIGWTIYHLHGTRLSTGICTRGCHWGFTHFLRLKR
jgi:hypothetical protein